MQNHRQLYEEKLRIAQNYETSLQDAADQLSDRMDEAELAGDEIAFRRARSARGRKVQALRKQQSYINGLKSGWRLGQEAKEQAVKDANITWQARLEHQAAAGKEKAARIQRSKQRDSYTLQKLKKYIKQFHPDILDDVHLAIAAAQEQYDSFHSVGSEYPSLSVDDQE